MLRALKRILVESFVGAIGLGLLLANIVMHFAGIFAAPVSRWIALSEYGNFGGKATPAPASLNWKDASPDLIRFAVLLAVWYLLLRWLYYKPVNDPQKPAHDSGIQTTSSSEVKSADE